MIPNNRNGNYRADRGPPSATKSEKDKHQKNELVNRLYDQGFNHFTMPSVSRPMTKNSHAKTVTSKLYSLSNALTKPKTQKQHSILFNVKEQSYLSP